MNSLANQRFLALSRSLVRLSLRAPATMATGGRLGAALQSSRVEQVQPAFRLFSTTSVYQKAKADNEYTKQIETYIKNEPVVMFIKGTAEKPRCGFSKAVVDIMTLHGVKFQTHNVLENEEFKQSLKDFTEWPTIPQIFFKGEFIGGFDILLEMHKSGDLIDELKKIGIRSKLDDEDDDAEPKK